MAAILAVILALSALVMARRRYYRRHAPSRATLLSPQRSTVVLLPSGAVQSIQSAQLAVSIDDLERLWNPTNLENLARTYWRFLSRVTLGLIRVVYSEHSRSVVFLARPFRLLRFEAPEYTIEPDRGSVRWRIRDGLLVARAGRGSGYLAIDVKLLGDTDEHGGVKLRIEVEVSNFYPAIAAGFSMPVYEATQSSIHVLVTHAFLRSLTNLDLARSKVGMLAEENDENGQP